MQLRTILNCCIALFGAGLAHSAAAQETPGQRLAGVVAVAVSEYKLGVDATGKIVSDIELEEAKSFLADARDVAARLTGDNAAAVQALVDSLATSVVKIRSPRDVAALYDRFVIALGPDGALEWPSRDFDFAAGRRLYEQHCASCHGPAGLGDGPVAHTLDPVPAHLAGAEARSLAPGLLYRVLSVGVNGTAMKGWANDFTSDQRWDVVAYVNSLRTGNTDLALGAPQGVDAAAAIQRDVFRYIDGALEAARAGRTGDAADHAFDAYAAFEPLEATLRARDAGFVAALETDFLTLRSSLRSGDTTAAIVAAARVRDGLSRATVIATASSGRWATFLQSFLIALREGFEAILILGAIVAMLVRTGNAVRTKDIWLGAAVALAASAVTAVVLQTTLRSLPATREVIEGATMLVAVLVLFSVSYWIISKVESERWRAYIQERVSTAMARGGRAAFAGVAFLVVYREGAESALFYQALLTPGAHTVPPVLAGIAIGGVALAALYFALNKFGRRVPLRVFFAGTGALLYLMAFVFTGNGIRELQAGGVVDNTPLVGWPSIPALGIHPSVETLAAQWVLAGLFLLACGHTFITPWWRARRKSQDGQGPPSIEPASTTVPQPQTQSQTAGQA
ncbi:MAG TPA: cytochrome c/FTR1 family iron permease [Gemmatimonadaceae bacterium]|nr:cytochrome c/FTR1 family iron permease [Gemmatimonadaceae bacterium]